MKRIRVAILGQGRSGREIHGVYMAARPNKYRIVAVAELLKSSRDWAVKNFGCDAYRDYHALLKRDDIDMVINALPSHLHVPVTLEFLKAGFNCLCEKPLAQRAGDVDKLIAASRKSGKLLAIFQQNRYAPYLQQIKKVINSGVLGRIAQISFFTNGFSRRWDWQTLTERMGGNLLNTGSHILDQLLQLFGTDIVPEVTCFMDNVTTAGDADDHTLVILRGKNRPLIKLEVSSCCKMAPENTFYVYGSRGGLQGDRNRMEWQYYIPKENPPKPRLTRKTLLSPEGVPCFGSESLKWHTGRWTVPKSQSSLSTTTRDRFHRMLYKAVANGSALEVTPQQVRQQIAVIEQCQRQNPHIYG